MMYVNIKDSSKVGNNILFLLFKFEDALRRRGAKIGVPYWDWTKPNTHIPALAAEETYTDPYT